MRVLVTGASGFVGHHLVRALLARGDEVTVLTRDVAKSRSELPRECRVAQWQAGKKGPWFEELGFVDGVVNLAGAPVAARWTDAHKELVRSSRVDSTRVLVEAIAAAGESKARNAGRPRVLVNASATGYYGADSKGQVDESAEPGKDFLAKVCKEWEAEAQKAEELGVRVVRMRIGVVLGPNGGALAKMIAPGRMFVAGPVGKGDNHVSWVHVDDVVGMMLWALDDDALSGPINCTSPYFATGKELARSMANVLGKSAFRVPESVARVALGAAVDVVTGSQQVYPQRAIELGYEYHHARLVPALEAALMAE